MSHLIDIKMCFVETLQKLQNFFPMYLYHLWYVTIVVVVIILSCMLYNTTKKVHLSTQECVCISIKEISAYYYS